jgi:hypothetical protein
VFNALQTGTVRVSIQVNVLDVDITSSVLTDHLDITIIDEAKFVVLNNNFNSLILTPGSQLQLKTNRDNLAKKLSYELNNSKFVYEDFLDSQETLKQQQQQQQQTPCSNDKLSIDATGVLRIDRNINLGQYKHQSCVAVVIVRIEEDFKKQQYLYYFIKVKQIKSCLNQKQALNFK